MKRLCFLFLLLVGITLPSFAQGDLGFEIYPHPSECEVFCLSAPFRFPVMRTDMPWEVGLAYSVLDTICKTYTGEEIVQRIPFLSNDSLTMAWNMMHRVLDYDPFLFEFQWRYSIHHAPPEYRSNWRDVTHALNAEYLKRFGDSLETNDPLQSSPSKDIATLTRLSDGVYLIKVLNITERSTPGRFGVQYPSEMNVHTITYCADVEIRIVYYGSKWYSNCNPDNYELPSGTGCMRYTWVSVFRDSLLIGGEGRNYWVVGREYLVANRYAAASDPITGAPFQFFAGELDRFEIIDGNLLDSENVFKHGEDIPFSEADSLIRETVNQLTGR